MSYLFEGIRAGCFLAILVGPLVIMLLQLSLRRGTFAALMAAAGIWSSDLLFIAGSYYGIGSLEKLSPEGEWGSWMGFAGVCLLLGTAVFLWFRAPPDMTSDRILPGRKGVVTCWLQGFMLNSLNPFTVGFWTVFTLTQVHERHLNETAAGLIYLGILGVIVLSDIVKVLTARQLRDWLQPPFILKIQRVSALALAAFGVLLGWQVFMT